MRRPFPLLSLAALVAIACGPVRDRRHYDYDDEPAPADASRDDAGSDAEDAGVPDDAGQPVARDAGTDGGFDGGRDAGHVPDAGSRQDGGHDAGRTDNSLTGSMPAVPATVSKADSTCSNGRIVTVHAATDGDTISLANRLPPPNENRFESVRLIGINTPETWPTAECYGPEASARTKALVASIESRQVCLVHDPAVGASTNPPNVDAYGRTLAYVFYGPQWSCFLNAELVWDGFARDYPYTHGAVFEDWLRTLKDGARSARRGLWGACP